MKYICKNCNGNFYKPKNRTCPFCGSNKIESLKIRKSWTRNPRTQIHKDKTKYNRNKDKNKIKQRLEEE